MWRRWPGRRARWARSALGVERPTLGGALHSSATRIWSSTRRRSGMEGSGAAGAAWLVAPRCCRRDRWRSIWSTFPARRRGSPAAADAGATAVDGLGMLVHQAAAQLELWTGVPAPVDVMWQAAIDAA